MPDIVWGINRNLEDDGLTLTVDPNNDDWRPRVYRLVVTGGSTPADLRWGMIWGFRVDPRPGFLAGVNHALSLAGAARRFVSIDSLGDYYVYVYVDEDVERRLRASPLFAVLDPPLHPGVGPA